MRTVSITGAGVCAALLLIASGYARSEALSDSRPPVPAAAPASGIAWETSVDRAKEKARREDKPVLVLHLFGRLDEEFC